MRLTRGCPWNRCTFCRTYKRRTFSLRSVEEIEADIDAMARVRDRLLGAAAGLGPREAVRRGLVTTEAEWGIANALASGGTTAFLQDADSLVMKPENLRRVLSHLSTRFPEVERVTTYARSRTVARLSADVLRSYRALGLTRIHIGFESGSDTVLARIRKGTTADLHVRAGVRAREAGLELSEYWMPGLGGREGSEDHARESARVLNAIDPHFIRLRTLCLGPKLDLWKDFGPSGLTRQTDAEIVAEIRLFVENLQGIGSRLASDHILNLLGDLDGQLPGDKLALLARCDAFLGAHPAEQRLFQVGRRAGLLEGFSDLGNPGLRARAQAATDELTATFGPDRLEEGVQALMERFV